MRSAHCWTRACPPKQKISWHYCFPTLVTIHRYSHSRDVPYQLPLNNRDTIAIRSPLWRCMNRRNRALSSTIRPSVTCAFKSGLLTTTTAIILKRSPCCSQPCATMQKAAPSILDTSTPPFPALIEASVNIRLHATSRSERSRVSDRMVTGADLQNRISASALLIFTKEITRQASRHSNRQ